MLAEIYVRKSQAGFSKAPAESAHAVRECVLGLATEEPDDRHRRLRIGGERRHKKGKGKRRNEPHGTEPHGRVLQHRRARSQRVSSGGHPRVEPREIGLLAVEEADHNFYQYSINRPRP